MISELNSVVQNIQERLKECQQWEVEHQVTRQQLRLHSNSILESR